MIYSSSLNHIEDCFYEKRIDTSLNGYNDLHDHWISELDCFDRCLKLKPERCRSFEHWRSHRHGLCVRANISLTDQPSSIGTNLFVDYYEIDCRKDTKAVRLQTTTCPGVQLHILVTLNGIDGNYVLLGDSGCKPIWFNETHAQFITHVDNCSLTLNDGSIVGKLRWEGVDKDTNEARQYERFFLCPSDIYQIRSAHWTSITMKISTTTASMKNTPSPSSTHRRLPSTLYHDEQPVLPTHRIYLKWVLHNRTYSCPPICSISLYSLIHVALDDSTLISSSFFIDSCDLIALYPYSDYVDKHQLIYRGCPTDPTVIHLPSKINSLSTFYYSFYLYNILKEPIPFQIQCKILNTEQKAFINHTNCSSLSLIDNDQLSIIKNDKRDYSYILFRSSPVYVKRQLSLNFFEHYKSNIISNYFKKSNIHKRRFCFSF
ncbi:unnamed protein product [Rotaria sp. Silwood1]|nr:unnamed protein product [Rotaria sp. Silwood1]CAF3397970.1 unnamed protein product [Rotaria sp. Silwood1]CAF3422144.1 unnamed protein product [Rotaria sp. Silwood1]CAF4733468.1 unnamed protein product [Rotaria sp. Silwood1]CAF4824614.1 unnamed protein product [Rotaria sp. Silwood1]